MAPMTQSLFTPKKSAERRRPAQPSRRRNGGSHARVGAWKLKVATSAETRRSDGGGLSSGEQGVKTSAIVTRIIDGNRGCPRSQEKRCWRDEAARAQSRLVRDPSGSKSSNNSEYDGDARGRSWCGEAWETTAAVATQKSDRVGAGSGGTRPSNSESWGWTGAGGGLARGKAMLSAYGLQKDRYNSTCPRRSQGDSAGRQRLRDHGMKAGGHREFSGDGASIRGKTVETRDTECEDSGGGDVAHGRDSASNVRSSSSNEYRCRGGKARTQSSALAKSNAAESGGTEDKSGSGSMNEQDCFTRRAGHEKTLNKASLTDVTSGMTVEGSPKPSITAITSPSSRCSQEAQRCTRGEGEVVMGDGRHRPADHARRALEGCVVPPSDSAPDLLRPTQVPFQGADGCSATSTLAAKGQVAVLKMDGRGGSAAPPHRPQRLTLRAPSTASYSTVLPNLAGAGGVGVGMETGADFESGTIRGLISRDGSSVGGDGRSTPSVSRPRSHSEHSPWHARKHHRSASGWKGSGGASGAGFGRVHHHHHHHRQSHLHQDLSPRGHISDSGCGPRSDGVPLLSTDEEDTATVISPSPAALEHTAPAVTRGSLDRSWVAPPIASARPFDQAISAQGDTTRSFDRRPSSSSGRASNVAFSNAMKLNCSSNMFGLASNAKMPTGREADTAAVGMAMGREFDPFDRLMDAPTTASMPHSELIDHFKFAPRPTSRRGVRHQSGGEGIFQPEPAFCLFSGHQHERGGEASGDGSADYDTRGSSEKNNVRRSKIKKDGRS